MCIILCVNSYGNITDPDDDDNDNGDNEYDDDDDRDYDEEELFREMVDQQKNIRSHFQTIAGGYSDKN